MCGPSRTVREDEEVRTELADDPGADNDEVLDEDEDDVLDEDEDLDDEEEVPEDEEAKAFADAT